VQFFLLFRHPTCSLQCLNKLFFSVIYILSFQTGSNQRQSQGTNLAAHLDVCLQVHIIYMIVECRRRVWRAIKPSHKSIVCETSKVHYLYHCVLVIRRK
jgi:hypothetical protein